MNRKLLLLVSLSLVLLVPALLSAQAGGKRTQCGFGMGFPELDRDQQIKMEKLKLEHQLANIDLKAERMELRLKIKEELLKEEPNRKNIDKLVKSMVAIGEKMQMNRVDHMLAVKKILKPEQWKQFVDHHAWGMGGHRGAMGHRCCDGMKGHRCRDGMKGRGMMRGDRDPQRKGECPYREKIETDE
jgi:Spy/CpxP family protein refolding chaperone